MKERNYGIDLLKMFSMYLVVVLHVLGQGGILVASKELSVGYTAAWSLEIFACVAVNCFALASGYVGTQVSFKPRRLFNLWLVAVFYGLLWAVIFSLSGLASVGFDGFKRALLPFTHSDSGGYWYLTAYAVTFMLMPFYNFLINKLDKKKLAYLITVLLVLFSVIPAVKQYDYFHTSNGYSYVWLSTLYLVGAYMKKYSAFGNTGKAKLALLTALCVAASSAGHYLVNLYAVNVRHEDISQQADVLSNLYGNEANFLKPSMFTDYTFPTTVLTAVLLLALFSKINVKSEFARGRISAFMPLVFSVYLIHTNYLVFENLLSGLFEGYASLNPALMILAVLGTALAVFAVCLMIDMLRFELFKLIKIDKLCEYAEQRLRQLFCRLFKEKQKG